MQIQSRMIKMLKAGSSPTLVQSCLISFTPNLTLVPMELYLQKELACCSID